MVKPNSMPKIRPVKNRLAKAQTCDYYNVGLVLASAHG